MSRQTGTVKTFNEERGFGFIIRDKQEDLFVHVTEITGAGERTLYPGDQVSFEVGTSKKDGRPRATNVRVQLRAQ